jgi:hypothetical protein
MIFNLLGTPPEEATNKLEREDAKRYIKCFAARPGDGLEQRFPHLSHAGLDGSGSSLLELLGLMLRFNPVERITVPQALEHSIFSEIRDRSKETDATGLVTLTFETEPDLDEQKLRQYFKQEIERYHK